MTVKIICVYFEFLLGPLLQNCSRKVEISMLNINLVFNIYSSLSLVISFGLNTFKLYFWHLSS